ncbi:carbohydrate ABC transporter permease [Natronosporangium hydrolyticum]|uniref:Carbohydrate ABC transporter permease n=1 Tax=Natronosporangium hydrolyticum TaxID=2811111 RepID=A0A895YAR7_9ACTN|nr:carbohydrate ABC transporter permease [Natronosporangium hydrolyticum]QSB13385.1 carbohydrate ABC transporter permease [Natronosporangium hydrolyticum]
MSVPPVTTATVASTPRRPRGKVLPRLVVHTLLIAGALVMIYPLLWLVASSLRGPEEVFRETGLIPWNPRFENYLNGWTALTFDFSRFYINSLLISTLAVFGNLAACSMAAYAFARIRFRLRGMWFAIMLITLMLPIHVLIVPQYVIFHRLGWIDSILPLTVPHLLAVDAFFIFLMVQFIRGIPVELDDAARIDGCGHVQIFLRIILPLMKPALVTTAIFTFIWSWDNFFAQLIFLNSPRNYTVPLALQAFLDSTGRSNWPELLAMSTLALVPIFVIFLLLQRRLTEGIATTGLKA